MIDDPGSTNARPERREHVSFLTTIFVSRSEPRLRAGWRLLLQLIMQSVLLIVFGFVLAASIGSLTAPLWRSFGGAELAISELAGLIAITVSVFVARKFLDRRSFSSLGLGLERGAMQEFGVGIAITFVMMGLIFALERALGWLQVTGFAWSQDATSRVVTNAVFYLVVCLLVAWNEELMSRGYLLQTIASGTNLTWGWIISSTVFGLLHLRNPHANLVAVTGIVLAGLFLGYAYIRTGRLWLAMGLHTGWNYFEGVVFGFPVSGIPFYHLARVSVPGPVLWTGGDFGPEAGLILLPALLLGFGMIFLFGRGRKSI